MKRITLFVATLLLTLCCNAFAQQQPPAVKNSSTSTAKPDKEKVDPLVPTAEESALTAVKNSSTSTAKPDKEKVDPLVPTAEESALMQPVVAEFRDAQKRLGEAEVELLKTATEKDAQVEKLKIEIAAKDARIALIRLSNSRAQFDEWVKKLRERAKCPDCLFNEQEWKLVKPPASAEPKK